MKNGVIAINILFCILVAGCVQPVIQPAPSVIAKPPDIQPTPFATATPPGWIMDWLTNPACTPPCWENIIPGVTPADTIGNIQSKYPDMSIVTMPGSRIVLMTGLHFSLYDHLPVQLLISKFGMPDHVRLYKCDPGPRCETHLIFAHLGMVINTYPNDLGENRSHIVEIMPETNIVNIYFIASGLDNYGSLFHAVPEKLNAWKGYGKYSGNDPLAIHGFEKVIE